MQAGSTDVAHTIPGMSLDGHADQSVMPPHSLNAASSYVPTSPSSVSSSASLPHSGLHNDKYLPSTPPEAHRYSLSSNYRFSSDSNEQNRHLVDSNRFSDSFRHLESQKVPGNTQRIRLEEHNMDSYYRRSEYAYQINNPVDFHRVPDDHSAHSAQVLCNQRANIDSLKSTDEFRTGGFPQQVDRRDSHLSNIPSSSLDYRNSFNSDQSHRMLQESMLRSLHDPQRLIQDNYRGYYSPPSRHLVENMRNASIGRMDENNMRYVSPENMRHEINRYSVIHSDQRNTLGDHPVAGNGPSPGMMPENLSANNSVHSMIAESMRGTGVHFMVPDSDMRVDNTSPHLNFNRNTHIPSADTPQSLLAEDLRSPSEETSGLVPENLCLSENNQGTTDNFAVNHEVSHSDISNIEANQDRLIGNHHSGSAISLFRPQYDVGPRILSHSPNVIRNGSKIHSPNYSEGYRVDAQCSISPAPPTPAPSIPPMAEQGVTPISQYYSNYPTHSIPMSSQTGQQHLFPNYMSNCRDNEPMNMSLEERIEMGFQDIKPFDQNYPGNVPMIHGPQDMLLSPHPSSSLLHKPTKPRKPKEPKVPRIPIIHKCDDCLRVFKNSTQLKNHMWRHTGEKPFTCDECGSKFTQQGNLRAHRRIHSGERPYECLDCKACFTQLSTLKTHQKIHTDERPYKCRDCDAAFRQIANLKTHLVTHTGERPHKCDQCDKAFTQKSNLKAHKNRVHSALGVSFPPRRGRKKVPVAVKSFSCIECGANFSVLSSLKTHLRIHSGDKRLDCEQCGTDFIDYSDLKQHIDRMHPSIPNGPKRIFKCEDCPETFRRRKHLKSHKKRFHFVKSLKIKILADSKYHMNSDGPEEENHLEEGDSDNGDDTDESNEEDDYEEKPSLADFNTCSAKDMSGSNLDDLPGLREGPDISQGTSTQIENGYDSEIKENNVHLPSNLEAIQTDFKTEDQASSNTNKKMNGIWNQNSFDGSSNHEQYCPIQQTDSIES